MSLFYFSVGNYIFGEIVRYWDCMKKCFWIGDLWDLVEVLVVDMNEEKEDLFCVMKGLMVVDKVGLGILCYEGLLLDVVDVVVRFG